MLQIILLTLFPFLVIYAAFSDLFSMTIPNAVSLALMAGFMVVALWTGMEWQTIAWHWAMFGLVLVVTFTLFACNVIGGGDAKLAAAVALWFGWEHSLFYFVIASLLGGLLTLLILKLRSVPLPDWIMKLEWAARIHRADHGVPYGISLGIAALWTYTNTAWLQMATLTTVQ